MKISRDSAIDPARALRDPSAVFSSPDELLTRADLPIDRKIEILCRWAYDASELAVAEEEGMGGGEVSRIHEVMSALDRITGGFDPRRTAPTKHGGFCVHRQLISALPDMSAARSVERSVPQGSGACGT